MVNVLLEPWTSGDLPLLTKLLGDPVMTEHLGGPEGPEKLEERQSKYERLAELGSDRMFKIMLADTGEAVGSVGYWARRWNDEDVYEIGWSVLPAYQGRGIAAAATRLAIDAARAAGDRRLIYAYPSIENGPSNAICRKLGFDLQGDDEFEYPPGHVMRCNVWRFDLRR